jgi:hypothetical protein
MRCHWGKTPWAVAVEGDGGSVHGCADLVEVVGGCGVVSAGFLCHLPFLSCFLSIYYPTEVVQPGSAGVRSSRVVGGQGVREMTAFIYTVLSSLCYNTRCRVPLYKTQSSLLKLKIAPRHTKMHFWDLIRPTSGAGKYPGKPKN